MPEVAASSDLYPPIAPTAVRYIKLGRGNAWVRRCLDHGEIHFGHHAAMHDLCTSKNWDAVAKALAERTRSPGAAKHALNEVRDFYTLGSNVLWITFAEGHLWWAFAGPEVISIEAEDPGTGARMRPALGGWKNTDVLGNRLRIDRLSSRLTQVASFRQTICRVKEQDYLLRRINSVPEPIIVEAERAREGMIAVAVEMIRSLHWADFEVMVDIVFSRGGWQRRSVLGETMPDVDLIIEQPTIGTTASVQVKSRAGQRELDDHIAHFQQSGAYDRTFFVCHSPTGPLACSGDPQVHVWTGRTLAEAAVKAGLFDWLMERSA